MNSRFYKIILVFSLAIIAACSVYFLSPEIKGDGSTYFEAMEVLHSGKIPAGFVPNRILTNFLGLETAMLFSFLLSSMAGWLLLNIIFYFAASLVFYNILIKIYKSEKAALLGTIFLAANYAMVEFGLNFLMDAGGWSFYIISLFFVLNYLESGNYKNLLAASAFVGIGGLFKEYAFLGFIPIVAILAYENRRQIFYFIKKIIAPGIFAFAPTLAVHIYVYLKFGYTYLDWFGSNQEHYVYGSRIIEYAKSLGSLLNVLGIVFLGGLWVLFKGRSTEDVLDKNGKIFLALSFLSILPAFVWPAITQRVLFIIVPFVILVSASVFKKYENRSYLFLPVLAVYVLASFFMDSFILNFVNLPF